MIRSNPVMLSLALWLGLAGRASAVELLSNGDFETGSLSGWTTVSFQDQGDFFIDTPGTTTQLMFRPTAPNPAGGSFYAVSDHRFDDAIGLLQTFTVSGSGPLTLSFDMFVNSYSLPDAFGDNGRGLDPTRIGVSLNQYARVDILSATASDFSTNPTDVVQNLYLGVDPGTNPNAYTHYDFDLTSLLNDGESYKLRFAMVSNSFTLNLGLDNVSLFSGTMGDTQIVPLPPAALAGLVLIGGIGGGRWIKRRRG